MQKIQDIIDKIESETKGLEQPELGEIRVKIISSLAVDYLELVNKDEMMLAPLLEHSFSLWLNTFDCLADAYKLAIQERLISEKNDKGTKLFIIFEIILSSVISFTYKHISSDNLVPGKSKADHLSTDINNLRNKLNLFGGIYSKFESKQYLLQRLLDDLLRDQEESFRNVYSSGTSRHLMRAIMTKRIILSLWKAFYKKNTSPRLIANIASNMIAVFFNPMDISDATELAEEIRKNMIEDDMFRKQTIEDYLMCPL